MLTDSGKMIVFIRTSLTGFMSGKIKKNKIKKKRGDAVFFVRGKFILVCEQGVTAVTALRGL